VKGIKKIMILVAAVAVIVTGMGVALAGGGIFSGGVSPSVTITTTEPISVVIASTMGDVTKSPLSLDPGSEFIMNYNIINASAVVDYVLEVHPVLTGSSSAKATIENFKGEFETGLGGSVMHLRIPAASTIRIQVRVSYPKDTPSGQTAQIVLFATRTACNTVASCPWG